MARNKAIKQQRDSDIYKRMAALLKVTDSSGNRKHTYTWCLSKVAEEFYLSPDTVQHIYLQQIKQTT